MVLMREVAEVHKYFVKQRPRVYWRLQGRGKTPGERAIVVPYVEIGDVKKILRQAIISGVIFDWTAEYEILGNAPSGEEAGVYVRCTLRVLVKHGEAFYTILRQDVGEGKDLKAAFSDALKRASSHLGIGALLENLSFQSVKVDTYGRPLPEEEKRLEALVEEAYRKTLRELGEEGSPTLTGGQNQQFPSLGKPGQGGPRDREACRWTGGEEQGGSHPAPNAIRMEKGGF